VGAGDAHLRVTTDARAVTHALGHNWSCHVCGKTRPDPKILVVSRTVMSGPIEIKHNLRYCGDSPGCANDAQAWAAHPDPQNWHDGL